MSKIKKVRDVKASAGQRRRKPSGAGITGREEHRTSPDKRPMKTQPYVSEDRIATARQRITDGFYDRDEVRRAIAEALVFVLGSRRD